MLSSSSTRTAALAGFVVGSSCMLLVSWMSKQGRSRPKSRRSATTSSESDQNGTKTIPKELREEQLSRHTLYFGEDGMSSIQNSKVCVVGLGGVGSHTAVMLARGGVETLRFIDFDQVTLSSLNRHACATLQDVGIPKVT